MVGAVHRLPSARSRPVLLEPLVKLLLPVAKIVSPGVSPLTRLYLFLILLSNVAVWAFCGGIITRIAAVQLANKGPITLQQAVRFVCNRYLGYLGAPLVPLVIIGVCVVGLIALRHPRADPVRRRPADPRHRPAGRHLLGGAVMAVFLVGLVGYPLMYPTLSAEGDQSDTFDALSRSINYVYQSPWHYIWYWLVAILYGAAVTFFVLFFASLTVYVGQVGGRSHGQRGLERPQARVPVHLRPRVVRLEGTAHQGQPLRGPAGDGRASTATARRRRSGRGGAARVHATSR